MPRLLVPLLALVALALAPAYAHPPQADLDTLLERIENAGGRASQAQLEAIGKLKTLPALRALERLTEELQGEMPRRYAYSALRHFLDDEDLGRRALDHVSKAARSREATTASPASGAFAWFGPKAREEQYRVALDAHHEFARASMIAGLRSALAAEPTADAREIILGAADVPRSGTWIQLVELVRAFRTADDFEAFARFVSSKRSPLARKRLVLAAMEGHPRDGNAAIDAGADQVLAAAAREKDPIVRYHALTAMARRGGTKALKVVEKLTREKDPTVRRAALLVAARMGSERVDPLRLAADRDPISRQAAAITLGERDDDASLDVLHQLAADADRTVRAEALHSIGGRLDPRSIPVVIARLGVEDGRLRADASTALTVLTGRDYGTNVTVWERFWQSEAATFVRPTDEELAEAEKEREEQRKKRMEDGVQSVAAFYGIEIVSNRFALIVDTSGSMGAKAYTGGTRLVVAKRQLDQTMQRLPDGVLFNIIAFSNAANPYEDELVELDETARADARAYTDRLRPVGGTNIHDALRTAFRDMRVDTIYLMSDGAPSAGLIADADELRTEVERWNSVRGVKIHCIAVGQDHRLLKGLAEDSGGVYVRVD